MKCWNCGAELQDGVLYCRECGSKVAQQSDVKIFCKQCGHELQQDVLFCSYCGARVNEVEIDKSNSQNNSSQQTSNDSSATDYLSSVSKHKSVIETPEKLSAPEKKKKKNAFSKSLTIIAVIVVLIAAFLLLYSKTDLIKKYKELIYTRITAGNETISGANKDTSSEVTNYTIRKGTQYAYMCDEWDLYLASALSDSIIKIEKWDKTFSSEKSVKLREEIGVFKINDAQNGFSWIDSNQLAFTFLLRDKNNSRLKRPTPVIFTIDISDKDEFKGSNYDKDIRCYSYENDDWHFYRAVPLTDELMKIEVWTRGISFESYVYGYDKEVINISDSSTDFEWTDESHTAFTITMKDPANKSNWKNEKLVAFTIENEEYGNANVLSFLGITD